MKKVVILCFLVSSFGLTAQVENSSIEELTSKLVKTWILDEMKIESDSIPFPVTSEITFFKDHTYENIAYVAGQKRVNKETWNIEKQGDSFIINLKNKPSVKIIAISEESLIISKEYEIDLDSNEKQSVRYFYSAKK
ncbi:MAG: hypothetical protein HRT68_12445 [Flavobacteriaceae bacterium]|nr:hypothetical protein [Flavobacteriaceae bacterium]